MLCSPEDTFEFNVEDKLVFPSSFIILQIFFLRKTQIVTKGLSYFRLMSGIFTGLFEFFIDIDDRATKSTNKQLWLGY